MLYRYIAGKVCSVADLNEPRIWRGVARRLGEWHAVLPITSDNPPKIGDEKTGRVPSPDHAKKDEAAIAKIEEAGQGLPTPNVWSVMQKWILALPTSTEAQKKQKAQLQKELERTVKDLSSTAGPGKYGLVFSHCDLLHGNVIIDAEQDHLRNKDHESVSFIDYE
jgi:ethanolamine kinase